MTHQRNREATRRGRRVLTAATVAGVAAVGVGTAVRTARATRGTRLTASTTIGKPPQVVYNHWRRLDLLPEFMAHLDEVRVTGTRTSHWTASAPFGRTVEWDAEITEDVPGERLSWRSVGRADVGNQGTVRFLEAPGGTGTEVHVELAYQVPGGALGRAVARHFGEEPHQQLDDDLRRFKQVLETGEVVRSDGAPWGKRARHEYPQRPAQPLPSTRRETATREEVPA